MLDNIVKINYVEQEGFLDFRHISGNTWGETRGQFFDKYEIKLPSWRDLKKIGKRRDLRLLLSPLTITIVFKNSMWWQYKFNPGFITDLASVPGYFRSIVDNDDIDLMVAALVHDRNFSIHEHSFKVTNELFYKMVMARDGVPGSKDAWISLPVRAKLAWLAVRSIFGRIRFKRNAKRRGTWTQKTTEYMESRGPTE